MPDERLLLPSQVKHLWIQWFHREAGRQMDIESVSQSGKTISLQHGLAVIRGLWLLHLLYAARMTGEGITGCHK